MCCSDTSTFEWNAHAFWRKCHYKTSWAAPSRVNGTALTKTEMSGMPALIVTWTRPQSDLTITQYQVQHRSGTMSWDNATAITVSPPANSTILTGLDAGTEYTVRVRAVSVIGAGAWSVEQTGRLWESENLSPSPTVLWYMYTCGRCFCGYNYIVCCYHLAVAIIYIYT